jgi:hypothetical protein
MADSKLYADDHPTTSLQGTGFKDAETATKTLKLIGRRSSKYQYDVVNTMYNRAKYHPHQTSDMKEAMKIYKKWLLEYKTKKEDNYEFLPISIVSKYSDKENVFLSIYKKVKTPYKLQYIPMIKDRPDGYDYHSYRNKVIKEQLQKIKKLNLPLYTTNTTTTNTTTTNASNKSNTSITTTTITTTTTTNTTNTTSTNTTKVSNINNALHPSKIHIKLISVAYSPDKRLYS